MSSNALLIKNGTVITPERVLEAYSIFIKDGKIAEISPSSRLHVRERAIEINAKGKMVCPGLINIHLHGGGGHDATEGTSEAIKLIATTHAKFGTTSILPTIPGFSDDARRRFFESAKQLMDSGTEGAQILGVNWETPFINEKFAGAFDKRYIQEPSLEAAKKLLKESLGTLKIVTIAPELHGALEVIKYFRDNGVIVSLGHSNATFNEAVSGIKAGATIGTHIFNASSGLHHRDPGLVGALLISPEVTVELIADGYHVHPVSAELVYRTKGVGHIVLMTDSIEVTGTDLTEFTLASGMNVKIHDGRTWGPEGQIIGSILTLDVAVKNAKSWFGINWDQAIKMATSVPANILGLGKKGSLKTGNDADIIIVDENFIVHSTIVGGKVVYSK